MNEWFESVDRRLQARRKAADLSAPPTYAEVLRYLFWNGVPVLVGPAVIVVGQVVANGVEGAVLFGGGVGLFLLAVLAVTARLKGKPSHAGLFVFTGAGLCYGTVRWTTAKGASGIGAWVVGFLAFVSVLLGGVAHVALTSELADAEQ